LSYIRNLPRRAGPCCSMTVSSHRMQRASCLSPCGLLDCSSGRSSPALVIADQRQTPNTPWTATRPCLRKLGLYGRLKKLAIGPGPVCMDTWVCGPITYGVALGDPLRGYPWSSGLSPR